MRWIRLTVSFGLSLIFLYLTFFIPHVGSLFRGELGIGAALFGHMRFDIAELGHVLGSAQWAPILMAGLLFAVSLFVRAWRWRVMLEPLARMSFGNVFGAMSIGYMANNVLPLRMGEVYRAHVVYQLSGLSRSAAFGSIVLERVTDLLFMIPFIALAILLFPLPPAMAAGAWLVAGLAMLVMGFFIWLVLDRNRALDLARKMFGVLPRRASLACMSLLEKFTGGLMILSRLEHLFGLAVSSLLLWVLYAGMVYFVLSAVGFMHSGIELIDRNPVGAVLVTLLITTVGFVIPGAPGGVGTYHGLAVLGLGLFDVPADRAAGFAILLHALNYIPLTVLGLVFFWKQGLSFRDTQTLAAEAAGDRQACATETGTAGPPSHGVPPRQSKDNVRGRIGD